MGWTVTAISSEDIKKLLHYQLETKFERIFNDVPKSASAAMFRERRPAADVHKFYFTPRASEILRQNLPKDGPFALGDCSAPSRADVVFVAGDISACMLVPGDEGESA